MLDLACIIASATVIVWMNHIIHHSKKARAMTQGTSSLVHDRYKIIDGKQQFGYFKSLLELSRYGPELKDRDAVVVGILQPAGPS